MCGGSCVLFWEEELLLGELTARVVELEATGNAIRAELHRVRKKYSEQHKKPHANEAVMLHDTYAVNFLHLEPEVLLSQLGWLGVQDPTFSTMLLMQIDSNPSATIPQQ